MTGQTKRVRVLIVDDSAFMRRTLHEIITADGKMEVIGQARDGREAVSMSESLRPDVITMDLNMPHMDGLEATELIMTENPRPIVVVSSESREGAASTLRALELGAIDFVPKPSGGVDLDLKTVSEELMRKLKMAAKVRVVRTATRSKMAGKSGGETAPKAARESDSRLAPTGERFPIVVIAASTGGPATLMRLIPKFPKDFPAAIFLVQHMPPSFTSQFSLQLAEVTSLRVKEAETNELVQPGTVYICPGSHHMRLSHSGRITLDAGERISGYRPCADVTFETVVRYAGAMTIAAVLTGMGNDGVRGVQAVKAAGGLVIAQDEATAVIFGMPAEAIKTGAVDHVLALDEIGPIIEKRVLKICRATQVSV